MPALGKTIPGAATPKFDLFSWPMSEAYKVKKHWLNYFSIKTIKLTNSNETTLAEAILL